MFRIGQFSRYAKLSVKALRYYEAEGLLKPAWIDPANNYRYYSSSQLPEMHRINSLRQCGLSISEIRSILQNPDQGIEAILLKRRAELERQLQEQSAKLSSIHHYLELLGKGDNMQHQIVVKELPAVLVYSKRMKVESYKSYFEVIPEIGRSVSSANPDLRCKTDPPYCFIMYHDGAYREQDIDIEFCEAVERRGTETAGIVFKNIPAVRRAACVLHKGPYESLSEAYAAVFQWIEDNNHTVAGPPRESYIDGIWNQEDPQNWLTELQVPITL
ncbi:MerR family transcriptional regulator [Spirochaeta dissipatitropha]